MAKLNYSKPLFNLCPIPLAGGAAGTAGGCADNPTIGDFTCPVLDFETGKTIFQNKDDGCKVCSLYGDDKVCYFVPTEDHNIYNS